ncbi:MAG: GNAT family N-acetyltransferase [Pseudonocardiaceae bacterium]|nr:GNAT family N-acetyltransferase [Pseudonocardiaceae bacterium]
MSMAAFRHDRRARHATPSTPACGPNSPLSVVALREPDQQMLSDWDALVDRDSGSDVPQLCAWARIRRNAGYAAMYVLVRQHGELVAGAQILHRRLPLLGAIGYVPYGPVIAPGVAGREAICGELARALQRLSRTRLAVMFVQPPEGADDVTRKLLERGFRISDAGIAPAGSIRVDLGRSVEELRSGLSRRLRTWTRRWGQRGVTVRLGGAADVPLLADLIGRSAGYHGYDPLSADYIATLYAELADTGRVALFVGEVHDEPVSAELYTACGGMVRPRLTGLDRSGDAAKLSVTGAVTWEAMRWAKERGYRWFDFGGLRDDTLRRLLDGAADGDGDGDETWPSDDRFKLSFGGTAFRYPAAVELISSPLLRKVYDFARRSNRGRRLIAGLGRKLRGGMRRTRGR